MNCREFTDFLMAYLDRELAAPAHEDFEGHLEACPPCERYLQQYRHTIALGRRACDPDGPVPAEVPEDLVRAILSARRKDG